MCDVIGITGGSIQEMDIVCGADGDTSVCAGKSCGVSDSYENSRSVESRQQNHSVVGIHHLAGVNLNQRCTLSYNSSHSDLGKDYAKGPLPPQGFRRNL